MATKIDLGRVLRVTREEDPSDVVDTVAMVAGEMGGTDAVVYLVDFEQEVLEPLPDRSGHVELPHTEDVASSLAGEAFLNCEARTAPSSDGTRIWVPILEGCDTTGVLAMTVPEADGPILEACKDLGSLAGCLMSTQARFTDFYNLHRRREAMSLAATMQWDLLPPLNLSSRRAVVAGMLEPAYGVGGDCFDYALNGSRLDLAMMDSMGHGLHSAMIAGLAMSSYRHDRREARSLELIHANLDSVIAAEGQGAFVTGQIGHLDLATGTFTWINAGHPPPLLVRGGGAAAITRGFRTLPWGLGGDEVRTTRTSLEPGDSVLFYTDGVTEIRGRHAEAFGSERLADLLAEHASDHAVGLVVRHIIRAVVEHHDSRLPDDAAVLMIQWLGP
jgi:hypothetical protein